ncbi:SDR family NAD(P)-dependent oxidoreductase [Nonomuraea sp. NPDC049637]|uniref:SDR family NAD(P)-dependent oxidoreductase n=1 Tax=Nonomuraea sp. NPDC049637 TaxID=3154356 RepID=UPI0034462CD1
MIITGGTDGFGKGLALHYLRQGAHVVAIGSTAGKGEALLAEAEAEAEALAGRATFVRADLTSLAACRGVVDRLAADHPVVDKLILCAQRYRLLGGRATTGEGFEHSFALAYLSRFVLSHGLHDVLRAARRPVVMNVGTPGVPLGRIHWDDLQLTRGGRPSTRERGSAPSHLGEVADQ